MPNLKDPNVIESAMVRLSEALENEKRRFTAYTTEVVNEARLTLVAMRRPQESTAELLRDATVAMVDEVIVPELRVAKLSRVELDFQGYRAFINENSSGIPCPSGRYRV